MDTFVNSIKLPRKLNIPSDFTFGVEIEFEKAKLKEISSDVKKSKINGVLSKGWKLKQDNSLTMYKNTIGIGGELISPVLNNSMENYKELRNACHVIERCGGEATRNCGGHIHIGSKVLEDNLKYYIRLMKLWVIYEDEIVRFGLGESDKKRPLLDYYAKPSFNMFANAIDFNDSLFQEIVEHTSKEKYMAISFYNLKPCSDIHTIEIRCPNGTINPIIWKNNINFFAHLLLVCKDETRDWELIDRLYKKLTRKAKYYHVIGYDIKKAIELSNFVFNDELSKDNFLIQYEKDSKILTR